MNSIKTGGDAPSILLGAIIVLATHTGFASLEPGTVRKKSQVSALVKILVGFAVSIVVYFFIGYSVVYGANLFTGADVLAQQNDYELVEFFFLLAFAATIPVITSSGIAERSRFESQLAATFVLVGLVYPFPEGIIWDERFDIQHWLQSVTGAEFHDFTGSVVVHAVGGWIALSAVLLLGACYGHYKDDGRAAAYPSFNIPSLAAGAWVLTVGWFGFGVVNAQTLDRMGGLVTINLLMVMMGGAFIAWWMDKNGPDLLYNGPLVDSTAVCAGSDVIHPLGALTVGGIVGILFVWIFTCVQNA